MENDPGGRAPRSQMRIHSTVSPVRSSVSAFVLAGVAMSFSTTTGVAAASEADGVHWHDEWHRFTGVEYATTGASLVTAFTFAYVLHPPAESRWTGTNAFDDAGRDWLRARSPAGQQRAENWSNYLFLGLPVYALAIEPWAVAWGAHGSADVAGQMFMMDLEVYGVLGTVSLLSEVTVARKRPYAHDCVDGVSGKYVCGGTGDNISFFSGHAAAAFATAGLTCVHHAHLPLYGGGAFDTLACVGAFGAAGATGLLRIVADKHWTSDVLIGATLGTVVSLALPNLLHYGKKAEPVGAAIPGGRMTFAPVVLPRGLGGGLLGYF
jgi:hypothetical protein